jgi:hypothetical protein
VAQLTLSDYRNNLFSNHFLEERIQEMKQWEETDIENRYKAFLKHYEKNKDVLDDRPKEGRTWSNFTRDVFRKILNHRDPDPQDEPSDIVSGDKYNPDYTLFSTEEEFSIARKEDNEFEKCYAIVEHKRWGTKFGKSTQDHRNPEYQIYDYINTLRVPWGILTDGKKWRLYSYEKCDKKIFFEIDLKDSIILEQDEEKAKRNFKLFYLLFRRQAFTPKREGFADKVLEGTIKYNKQLKDNLKKDVYSAVETACKGFFEFTEQEATEENRKLVHDSALTLMYRLLFIMNAESRGLLPVENQTYQENYSVQRLQELIVEKEDPQNYFSYNTVAWDRLEKLFKAINSGDPLDEKTKIPPYNGGMFEHPEENEEVDPENKFLAENSMPGTFLKQIIKRLGTAEEDGKLKTMDYRDLDIRHLGSIYEGLLENELQPPAEDNMVLENEEWNEANPEEFENADEEKRVKEGEVYLATDSGERKETGSYYTPDYIVEYIVENTVGPKIEEKIESFEKEDTEADKLSKILELNVCDPAMGSGHFLTEATNYIADALLDNLRLEELDIQEADETNWAKRQVVQNCIYGVDINPLATELAKVSLWIETMAEGKPLNFLDHHLKVGNSLIGADLEEIKKHPDAQSIEEDLSKFNVFVNDAKEGLKAKYRKIENKDEKTIDDIKEKEKEYQKFKKNNEYYQKISELCNIYTHQYFDGELTKEDYKRYRGLLYHSNQFKDENWFQEAQEDAKQENRSYFHWELEFPQVFFGETQGFDAVVGNPPYVNVGNLSDEQVDYLFSGKYDTVQKRVDLYVPFLESAIDHTTQGGYTSFIIPHSFCNQDYARKLRLKLLDLDLDKILDIHEYEVFEDADVKNIVPIIRNKEADKSLKVLHQDQKPEISGISTTLNEIDPEHFRNMFKDMYRLDLNEFILDFKEKIDEKSFRLGKGITASWGARGVPSSEFHFDEKVNGKCEKLIKGENISPFNIDYKGKWILYDYDELYRPAFPEVFENNKVVVPEVTGSEGVIAAYDEEKYYTDHSICNCIKKENLEEKSSAFLNRRKIEATEDQIEFSRDIDLKTIAGLLNSKLIHFYFSRLIGHELNVYPESVEYLPIAEKEDSRIKKLYDEASKNQKKFYEEVEGFLEWIESEWGVEIEDLSLKTHLGEYWKYDFDSKGTTPSLMRVARNNKSEIDGNVKSRKFRELMKEEWENSMNTLRPLMQEIDELENEIDAIVFEIYDLSEDEVRKVLDSLDTTEDSRQEILNSFKEKRNN